MGVLKSMFSSRPKVMGVPVGPKQTDWGKIAKAAAGAVAAGGAAITAAKSGAKVTEKGQEALESGKQVVEKGRDLRDKAASVGDAMSGSGTAVGKAAAAVKEVASGGSGGGGGDGGRYTEKQRLIIREQIDVAVPRRVAYNQWTQFEDFPNIFRGVDQVEQVDDQTVAWTGKILWSTRQWRARITEQIPDELIRWVTKGGVNHKGVVTFHELDGNLTRILLEMEYFPRGFVEKFGNLFLTARHRVRKDLRLFKHFIELEGEPTGEWRGEITRDEPGTGTDEGPAATGDADGGGARDESSGDGGADDDGEAETQRGDERASGNGQVETEQDESAEEAASMSSG